MSHCPSCDSAEIEGGSLEVVGSEVTQDVTCRDCDAAWLQTYELTSYIALAE